MAAIALVDEGTRGLQAGDGRDARHGFLERVAVVRVAVQGADIGHKLAAGSARVGGGHCDLAAELIRLVRLTFVE